MKNFEILNNFPQDFINRARCWWEENKDISEIYQGDMFKRIEWEIPMKELEDDLGISGIIHATYMIGEAKIGISPPHADKRPTTINIPIEVDFNKSFFYSSNKNASYYEGMINNLRKYHEYCSSLEYNESDYIKYNVEKPLIANTNIPHGWANFSDNRRVLLSLSFSNTQYKDVLSRIPKEWF